MDRLAQQRLKKELGLPSSAKYLGYVLNIPASDEYLAFHEESGGIIQWAWAALPQHAKRYKNLKSIREVQRDYTKYKSVLCYLFDLPDRYVVAAVEESPL
jgi:uncharacterized protein VirK/YbjX